MLGLNFPDVRETADSPDRTDNPDLCSARDGDNDDDDDGGGGDGTRVCFSFFGGFCVWKSFYPLSRSISS